MKLDLLALWYLLGIKHKANFWIVLVHRDAGKEDDPYHNFEGDHLCFENQSWQSQFFQFALLTPKDIESKKKSGTLPSQYLMRTPKKYILQIWDHIERRYQEETKKLRPDYQDKDSLKEKVSDIVRAELKRQNIPFEAPGNRCALDYLFCALHCQNGLIKSSITTPIGEILQSGAGTKKERVAEVTSVLEAISACCVHLKSTNQSIINSLNAVTAKKTISMNITGQISEEWRPKLPMEYAKILKELKQ